MTVKQNISSTLQAVYETRRENLKMLAERYDGVAGLGTALGHSSGSYISQLAGPNPSRPVTEKVARDIEQKLDLSPYWLDIPRA